MTSTPLQQHATRTLTAFIEETDSYEHSNPIHSTEGGQAYGFKAALVPGVTVYGWAVPDVTTILGPGWFDYGWAEIVLRRPTYPDDLVTISADREPDGTCRFSVVGPGDELRLSGAAGVGDAPWIGELSRPTRLRAEPRIEGDHEPLTLANVPIGEDIRPMAIEVTPALARATSETRYRTTDPTFVGEQPRIHPAAYVNLTGLLKHTYAFAPSIHTASRIQYLRPAQAGQTITLAAHCVEGYEKRGHGYVTVDGVMLGEDGLELTRMRHTVIFSVAKPAATA